MAEQLDSIPYTRVLLKLSGETLQARGGSGVDSASTAEVAKQIREVAALGIQVAIVIGGGNIFRGFAGAMQGVDRGTGDSMGMLATMINSLALGAALEKEGVPAHVMSATPMDKVAEYFTRESARTHLEAGRVVLCGGGTGNPFFTTDSAAALRAAELNADVLLKATKVDGIYDADPMKHPEAKKFDRISYAGALNRQLKVMDAAAFSLCMENNIPIQVFNFFKEGELLRAATGQAVGTTVSQQE